MSSSSAEELDTFRSIPSAKTHRKQAPKPDIIKRATSNQNETVETKPDFDGHSVKRVALNRDGSIASNRLKAECMPGYFDNKQQNIERPQTLSLEERMSTLDIDALDLVVRPMSLGANSRSTTIDALDLDFDDERAAMFSSRSSNYSSLEDLFTEDGCGGAKEVATLSHLPKPSSLTAEWRLTTTDLIDIVNEPISEG